MIDDRPVCDRCGAVHTPEWPVSFAWLDHEGQPVIICSHGCIK